MQNNGQMSSSLFAQYGPKLVGPVPGPKARAIVAGDERYISPSYTRSYPMVAKRGRGVRVEDVDGNEFLDFAAGIAVVSTGHCHPEVVAAIQQQAAELIHISGTDFYYEHMVTLAERLSAIAPMPGTTPLLLRKLRGRGDRVRAQAGPVPHRPAERDRLLWRLPRAHHGCSFAHRFQAPATAPLSPLVPGVTHVRYPYAYRGCSGGPQEEERFALACARYIEEKLFKTTLPPEEVAAIFVEPIQGEGGYVVAPDVFMQELRRICDKHGILLVVDEVQSGAGRTGKWWAVEHSGVQPDMVCIAKGIASGMPLGICMTRAELMDWVPGSHASTFGGNPVAIAAALATMDILEREGIANAATMGEVFFSRLRDWPARHPIVGDVRGRGLMIGLEIVKSQQTREPAPTLRDRIVSLAFEKGLLLLGCGETSIRLAPPLTLNQHEAAIGLDIFEQCVAQVEEEHAQAASFASATV